MIHAVPVFVRAGIKAYDSALRLRWAPLAGCFVLERRIQHAQPGSYDNLMATYANRVARLRSEQALLGKALAENPLTDVDRGLVEETSQRVAVFLVDTAVRLEGLQQGHLFIYWVPRPTANEPWAYRLTCILYTLRTNDILAAGGSDKVHDEGIEQERGERERAARKRRSVIRDGATEIYDDIQRKSGERILVGANLKPEPTERLLVVGG